MLWYGVIALDLVLGLVTGCLLVGRGLTNGALSVGIAMILSLIVKAVILGTILGLFGLWTPDTVVPVALVVDVILGGILAFFIRDIARGFEASTRWIRPDAGWIAIGSVLILLSLGIYNTIPFGGDELMYHLSITVEMLHHGGWTMDLGLSHYWHNDIWQWYPKHHYFVMGYLLALAGMSIVGVQIAGILAMLLFALATARLLSLLFEDAGIEYGPWLGLSTVLTLSIPVVFLHFFVRGDTFLHALILIILVLLLRRSYLMAGFLGAFILWFKLTAFIYVAFIFTVYSVVHFREVIAFIRSRSLMAWSMISTGLVVWIAFNCSNHINNWLVHGNPLYPLNIIHTEETGAWLGTNAASILSRLIFNDQINYSTFFYHLPQFFWQRLIYNYDNGIGLYGFTMVIGYVSFLAVFARRMTRFQLFLAIFAVGYMLYVSISTPLFLTLRYHLFALVILNAFVILLVSRFAWRWIFVWACVFLNVWIAFPFIGAYTQANSGMQQLAIPTTSDYCDKIEHIWNLERDDYRSAWSLICETMRDSNILLVNQVFSFYLYGRDFSNQLSAPLFFGPDEFARYLRDHRIDAVATSNKNNLYADYGTTEDSIYTSTHDSNDESVLFCDETPRSDVVSLSIKYQIDRDADTMVNFGINDFESATLLDNHHEAVILLDQPTDVRNTCITIFDTPTESLDRERKTVHISAIQYTLADGTSLSGTPSDYRFQDFPIETRWLKTLWWTPWYQDQYADLDFFTLWKPPYETR